MKLAMLQRRLPLLLVVLQITVHQSLGFSESEYTSSVELTAEYKAYYRVDSLEDRIYVALQADANLGWFGFGIPEPTAGDMDGSDIVTIEKKSDTEWIVVDRFALDKSVPTVDVCQDWMLEDFEVDGDVVTVEISRDLETNSTQDRDINTSGLLMIIWAYGSSSSDSIGYHDGNRGFASFSFEVVDPVPESWEVAEFQVSNFSTSATRTIYACQSFDFKTDSQYHAVRFEVFEDLRRLTSPVDLHHLVVYACNSGTGEYPDIFKTPAECIPVTGRTNSGCSFPMFTWAKGEQYYNLPSNVGFRIGEDSFDTFVVEMHYDNPDLVAGEIDSSTVKMFYTNELREFDAGVLVVGDPFAQLPDIPAGEEAYEVKATCYSSCTSLFGHEINVFGSLLHMHARGSQMWSTLLPASGEEDTYSKIDFYNYGIQKTNPVNFVLSPGDVVETHCIFDTTEEAADTKFGTSSADEMCMDFLYYYPYSKTSFIASHCGYGPRQAPTVYGFCNTDLVSIPLDTPSSTEEGVILFGLEDIECPSSSLFPTAAPSVSPSVAPSVSPTSDVPAGGAASSKAQGLFWVLLALVIISVFGI